MLLAADWRTLPSCPSATSATPAGSRPCPGPAGTDRSPVQYLVLPSWIVGNSIFTNHLSIFIPTWFADKSFLRDILLSEIRARIISCFSNVYSGAVHAEPACEQQLLHGGGALQGQGGPLPRQPQPQVGPSTASLMKLRYEKLGLNVFNVCQTSMQPRLGKKSSFTRTKCQEI